LYGIPSRHRKAQRLAAVAHVDGGKAGYGEARVPQSPCSLISNLLSACKVEWRRPSQRLVLEFDGAVSASTASAKLKICLG